jgi:hypothetical protein
VIVVSDIGEGTIGPPIQVEIPWSKLDLGECETLQRLIEHVARQVPISPDPVPASLLSCAPSNALRALYSGSVR